METSSEFRQVRSGPKPINVREENETRTANRFEVLNTPIPNNNKRLPSRLSVSSNDDQEFPTYSFSSPSVESLVFSCESSPNSSSSELCRLLDVMENNLDRSGPSTSRQSISKKTEASASPRVRSPPRSMQLRSRSTRQDQAGYISTNHRNTVKDSWRLSSISKKILIIGASNLNRVTKVMHRDVQIESFPGGQIRHFLNIMSHFNKSGSTPETLILHVGTNNRSQPASSSHLEFLKLVNSVKAIFPRTKICITPLTISDRLRRNSPLEAKNMSDFNFLLRTKTPGVCVIRQYPDRIFTHNDSIHWTENTANNIIQHWLSELSLNNLN